MRSEGVSREGNQHFYLISIRELVSDPQFKSGYRDVLLGLPPRRFFYDERAKHGDVVWGYERGRLTATWLLTTGQELPGVTDIADLAVAYCAAEAADAVL